LYDALDNRIGMDENGTQTWTLYDGSNPIMDFSGAGSLEMRYLNGPAGNLVDTVLSRQSAGGTVAWYLPDSLGTVGDLINNSGSVIDHIDYSAFGTVLDESAPSQGDRIMGFAGMERDTVAGLNLAVERVENPGTGRWDSQDPIGFAAGDASLYRYVGNKATYAIDPSGLQDVTVLPTTKYQKRPTLGRKNGVLKDPDLRTKMKALQKQYKKSGKNGPELGINLVWNPKTGEVGWTTKGVTPKDHDHIGLDDPCIEGWVYIGTIHTHEGSPDPSPTDGDNARIRGVPGVILWGPYYKIYGRERGGPIDYQNPNPGKQPQ